MAENDDIKNATQIQKQTHAGLYRLNHSDHMQAKKRSLMRELKREHLSPDKISAYKAFVTNDLKDVSAGTKQMRNATRISRQRLDDLKKDRHPKKGLKGYIQYKRYSSIYKMLKHKFAMVYTNHVAKTNPDFKMASNRLDHITKPRFDINTQFNETNYDLGANSKLGREDYSLGTKSDKAFANEENDMTKNYHIISGNKLRREFGKDPFKDGTKIKRARYYTLSDQQINDLRNPDHMHKFSGKTLKQHGFKYDPNSDPSKSKADAIDPKKSYNLPYGTTMNAMRHPSHVAMKDFKGSDLINHDLKYDSNSGKKIDPNKTYSRPKYDTLNQMKSYDFRKAHPRLAHNIDNGKQESLSDIISRHTHHLMTDLKHTGVARFLRRNGNSLKIDQKWTNHNARKAHSLPKGFGDYQDVHGHYHLLPLSQMRRISILNQNMYQHGLTSRQRFNIFMYGNAHNASYLKQHGIKSKGLLNSKPSLAHNATGFQVGYLHPEKNFDQHLTSADKIDGVNLKTIKASNHQIAIYKHHHSMKNGTSTTRKHAINKLGMNNSFGHKGKMASHSKRAKMRIHHSRGLHL